MLFVSKIKDQRIIRRPMDRIMDEQRRPIILKGERVEFNNWRFDTEDPDLIEWLLNHNEYGVTFTSDKRDDKAVVQPKKQIFLDTDDEATPMAKMEDNIPRELQRADKKFEKISMLNKKYENMKKRTKQNATSMARGSMATAWGAPAEEVPATPKLPALTEDRVATMINSAVESAVNRVVELMKAPVVTATKPTKTFHCKECGEEFKSGIAVGVHKKAVHSGKQE